jgi:thymidylate synthase
MPYYPFVHDAPDFDKLYRGVLDGVVDYGEQVAPRGQVTTEVRPALVTLHRPEYNLLRSPARNLNLAFSVAEWLWILLGLNDVATIGVYNKAIAGFSDDGVSYFGSYGPRVIEQLPYVVQTLRRDPESRQAVVSIWRERPGPTKDVPCTVDWQFFLRDGKLEMIAHMRSNDAYLGFPYDVFNFTQIQRGVALELGVEAGRYHHSVGSLHLYEQHYAKAAACEAEFPVFETGALCSPPLSPLPAAMRHLFLELSLTQGPRAKARAGDGHSYLELRNWLVAEGSRLPAPWDQYLYVLGTRWVRPTDLPLRDPYLTLLTATFET